MLSSGPEDRNGALLIRRLALQCSGLSPDLFLTQVIVLHPLGKGLVLLIEGLQTPVGLLLALYSGAVFRLEPHGAGLDLLQLVQPHRDLQGTQLVPQQQVALGFLRLIPQGLHLQLQLCDLVVDAHQVLLGAVQPALRLLLAVAVFADACRLLKDLPALGTLDGQYLVDTALPDDGVALPAQARVHKQFVDVPQTDGLLVDIILALPRCGSSGG